MTPKSVMSQPSLATAWASIWSLRRNCAMHHKPVRPALVNLIVGRLPIVAAIAFDARIGMRRPVTERPIIPGTAGREACHQNGHQEQANASSGVIRLGASLQKRCKVRWRSAKFPRRRATAVGPYGAYPNGPLTVEDVPGPIYQVATTSRSVLGARLSAALAHVHMLVLHPRDASPASLQALRDAGWLKTDIVTLSQLVAFLAFQIRAIAGLRALSVVDA